MKKLALLIIILAGAVIFADAGPSPPKPSITVNLFRSGAPYTGQAELMFVCALENASDSPIGQREINMTCSNGKCTNQEWFYKFNPCYYPDVGYFTYRLPGENYSIPKNVFSFNESVVYEVKLDVGTGDSSVAVKGPVCPLSLAILFVLVTAFAYVYPRKQRWL
ncbi:MAG: hypothetical protein PHS02_01905 [Candidatus ainarchaeum sp.]|nr:hypothetical protein [Candidatus ainarchaeum sp.]